MKKQYLPSLIILLCIFSCNAQTTNLANKTIVIEGEIKDTIICFKKNSSDTFLIYREVDIIENTNVDTLLLGFSIIPPKFTGKIRFIQQGLDETQAAYIHGQKELSTENPASFSHLFFLSKFGNRIDNRISRIKIMVKLK